MGLGKEALRSAGDSKNAVSSKISRSVHRDLGFLPEVISRKNMYKLKKRNDKINARGRHRYKVGTALYLPLRYLFIHIVPNGSV